MATGTKQICRVSSSLGPDFGPPDRGKPELKVNSGHRRPGAVGGEDFPALGTCDSVEDLKTSAECGSLEELTRGWGSQVSLAGSPGACTGTGRVSTPARLPPQPRMPRDGERLTVQEPRPPKTGGALL